jgi:hypothetical protein
MIRYLVSFLIVITTLILLGCWPVLADPQLPSLTVPVTTALKIPSEICSPTVLHTAMQEPYALVEWQCADGGGQLVLKLITGSWQPLEGDGGSYQSRDLMALGIPADIAQQLVQHLQTQWPQEE